MGIADGLSDPTFGGRFYARVVALQSILGKKELTAPLGPARREATRALPSAVAALQAQIGQAKDIAKLREPLPHRSPVTTQDYDLAVWQRRMAMLPCAAASVPPVSDDGRGSGGAGAPGLAGETGSSSALTAQQILDSAA